MPYVDAGCFSAELGAIMYDYLLSLPVLDVEAKQFFSHQLFACRTRVGDEKKNFLCQDSRQEIILFRFTFLFSSSRTQKF